MAMWMIARTGRESQRYNQGLRQVVGCVPYRYKIGINEEEGLEVLLISSSKDDKKMILPRGGWEIDEEMKEAATRETFEEAGVLGNIDDDLGSYMWKNKEGFMFSMLVKEEPEFWPDKDRRSRRWMTIKEAREVCKYQWMKEALEFFSHLHIQS